MQLRFASPLLAAALMLLATAVGLGETASWDEERLQWLVVTKPGAREVRLNCTSEYIYPFKLLNDSSLIGALGSLVKQVWWLLPDGRRANSSYSDGNRRVVDQGVGLVVDRVDEGVHGLYHCVAEAITMINETYFDPNRTTVYFYKRGLNLYGADIYGGSAWEKYKRNTLIGSLTAGTFLALIAGYALLERLGVFAKCAGHSNIVDSLGGGGPAGGAELAGAEMKAEAAPASTSPEQSKVSVRSRRSEKAAEETAEL